MNTFSFFILLVTTWEASVVGEVKMYWPISTLQMAELFPLK